MTIVLALALPAAAGADHDGAGTPLNDSSQESWPLTLNSVIEGHENSGATVEPGERLTCAGAGYRHTVWYYFEVPRQGRVVVSVTGASLVTTGPFDSVISLQGATTGIGETPLACNDDDTAIGGSRIAAELGPGPYFVQVGGYDVDPATADGADIGRYSIEIRYTEDRDLDDDGVTGSDFGGADCNDRNPNIRPGVPEIVDNESDENCDGYREYDGDDDGYNVHQPPRTPPGYDCNDRNSRVNPGRREIRGNSVDENCDGRKGRALLIASRIQGFFDPAPGGVRARTLTVTSALAGTVITARCKGGCPFSRKVRRVRRRIRRVNLLGWFQGKTLRSGASLRVAVLPPSGEWIGKTVRYRVRGGQVTPASGCVNRRGRARRCPS